MPQHAPSAPRRPSGLPRCGAPGLQRFGVESENEDEYDDLGSGSFDEEGMELAISAFQQTLRGQGAGEHMAFDRSAVRWLGNDHVLDDFEAALEGEETGMQRLRVSQPGATASAFAMPPEEQAALQAAAAGSDMLVWFREGLRPWQQDPGA